MKNVVANYFAKFWLSISSLLFLPIYLNLLGPASFAQIGFYNIICAIIILSDFGRIPAIAIRLAAGENPRGSLSLISSAEMHILKYGLIASACLILAFIALTLGGAKVGTFTEISLASLALASIAAIAQTLMSLHTNALMSLDYQVEANSNVVAFSILKNIIIIPLLYVKDGVGLFFLWQAISSIAFFAYAKAQTKRKITSKFSIENSYFISQQKSYIMHNIEPEPIFWAGLMYTAMMQVDKLILGLIIDPNKFGYYFIISTAAQIPLMLALPIVSTTSPAIFRNESRIPAGPYSRPSVFAIRSIICVSAPLVCIFIALSPELIYVWLGPQTQIYNLPLLLMILAACSFIIAVQHIPAAVRQARGDSGYLAKIRGLALAASVMTTYCAASFGNLIAAAASLLIINSMATALIWARGWGTEQTRTALMGRAWNIVRPACVSASITTATLIAAASIQMGPLQKITLGATGAALGVLIAFYLTAERADRTKDEYAK